MHVIDDSLGSLENIEQCMLEFRGSVQYVGGNPLEVFLNLVNLCFNEATY